MTTSLVEVSGTEEAMVVKVPASILSLEDWRKFVRESAGLVERLYRESKQRVHARDDNFFDIPNKYRRLCDLQFVDCDDEFIAKIGDEITCEVCRNFYEGSSNPYSFISPEDVKINKWYRTLNNNVLLLIDPIRGVGRYRIHTKYVIDSVDEKLSFSAFVKIGRTSRSLRLLKKYVFEKTMRDPEVLKNRDSNTPFIEDF